MPPIPLTRQSAIYRFRFLLGLVMLLCLAPLAVVHSDYALTSMFNAPAMWLPKTLPVRVEYDNFSKLFQGQDVLLVGWDGAILGSPEIEQGTEALDQFTKETPDCPAYLLEVASGQSVYNLLNSPPTSFSDRATRARLRESLIGPDGKQTVLLATFADEGSRNRRTAMKEIRSSVAEAVKVDERELYLAGPPADGALIDKEAQYSIQRFTFPSCLVGGFICFLCLRSWILALVVLMVAAVGQGMSLAAVYYSGLDMNAILIVLPPLVFVLTASAGIHLCNYYLDAFESDPAIDPTAATRRALEAGTLPCWLAATTTIIGLGSLGLVRLWPVSAFGCIAAASVFGTLLMLMMLLPGAMQMHGRVEQKRRKQFPVEPGPDYRERLGELWGRFSMLVLKHPVPVVLLFTVITIATGLGLPQLTTSVNIPRMFPAESRIRDDYRWFEEHLGPTINAEIVVAFEKDVMPDPLDRFAVVRAVDDRLRELEMVGAVMSARNFLPTPPRSNRRSLSSTILQTNIRNQIKGDDSALQKSGYLARDVSNTQYWRISFKFPFGEEIDYREEFARVQREITPVVEAAGPGIRPIYTGGVPMTTSSQDVLLKDLFRSFLAAFGIVAIIMMLLLRSVIGGLLAMFPNLFPTITLFGAMGLSQTPLDIGSVMTASVALGIAVDGTIHLLSRFRRHLREGLNRVQASAKALEICGPAMWQTTVVCSLAPLVYGFSEFVPTRRFAFMMFGLLSAALIGDVLLLPALLASPLGKWLAPKKDTSHDVIDESIPDSIPKL